MRLLLVFLLLKGVNELSEVYAQLDVEEIPTTGYITDDSYPQNALKCFSSMAATTGKIICPQFAVSYCVKEVSTLPKVRNIENSQE